MSARRRRPMIKLEVSSSHSTLHLSLHLPAFWCAVHAVGTEVCFFVDAMRSHCALRTSSTLTGDPGSEYSNPYFELGLVRNLNQLMSVIPCLGLSHQVYRTGTSKCLFFSNSPRPREFAVTVSYILQDQAYSPPHSVFLLFSFRHITRFLYNHAY